MKSMDEWLASIGLQAYAHRFRESAIDMSVVDELTEQDLDRIGVLDAHRRKLLNAIAELKRSQFSEQQGLFVAGREEAERRQLTVMFCDMVGSTAMSAHLDPEDMRKIVMGFHARVSNVVKQYGGTIARYMGDGVLAYFGYPHAQEDYAEQAVHGGLALIDEIANLNADTEAVVQVRIGIATGTVVVGAIPIEGALEQAVVGDAPNLAARLQAFAEPGTVLICANTLQLTKGLFQFRELEPVRLQGWDQPTPIWQVLEAKKVESRFEAAHEMKLLPLVGREEEIELLLRRWSSAKEGEGRVVMLTGEPGIGKSHISRIFDDRLKTEPHATLRYYCSPHHSDSAFYPIINQIERAAGFERGDSPMKKLAKLEDALVRTTPESIALIASLLALASPDAHSLTELTPLQRKEKTLRALLEQIDLIAAREHLLVILEDAHWIDPTSLEFLTAVVERAPRLSLLVLITARPEFTPPWPSYAHTTVLPLTRLSRRDGSALIGRVTGNKPLPEDLEKEVLARTDGVPLFIEELTKTILESGLLEERGGRFELAHALPPLAIPTTLQASLIARLDRLAPVREVAQIGAVIGREFNYELLNAVAGLPKERLEQALAQLVQSELVFRRGEIPDAVYIFKHSLVRDAAYSSLLKSRRSQLHAAIAAAMERQFTEIVQTQPETLARHLKEAGLIEKAIKYWLQAGKQAAMRSANLEAIAHLERGIEATAQLSAGEGRDKYELDLRLALGPCLIATQGPAANKAMETFFRARELCERLGGPPDCLQVMFWLATASVVRGQLPQALEAIAGLPSAAKASANQPALLNGIRGQAMILMFMGRIVEARETLGRAIDVFGACEEVDRIAARAAGQDAGMSIMALTAWVSWILGQVDGAATQMNAALERADTVKHAHTHAYAWYYASVLHALRGEPELGQRYAERCYALSEQHGFRQWLGLSRAIQGICAAEQDGATARLDEVKSALEDYRSAGYHLGLTAQFVLLCPILLRNELETATEVIEQGLSIVGRNSERLFEAEFYRLKARALLIGGMPDSEVESLLDLALRTARSQQARSLELRAATDLARFWMERSRRAEAADVLEAIYGRFTEGFATRDLTEAKRVLEGLRPS
jgi:class 3 adenylate cyclase/tetratricopeptide (TPR) repeat protein